jgi:superfamily II DNA or RNA helicase
MTKKKVDPEHLIEDLFPEPSSTPESECAPIDHSPLDYMPVVIPPDANTPNFKRNISLTPIEDWQVSLYRRLIRGRSDAFAVFFGNPNTTNKKEYGYQPALDIDKTNLSLTDERLKMHLTGAAIYGIYPILLDHSCYFVAVDFDKEDWRADAQEFCLSCQELKIPVSLEISRSGNGAHAWIFFDERVPAQLARQLATAIITHVCNRTGRIKLLSYDRILPNQDFLPPGNYGNLISMPEQGNSVKKGCTVFVDEHFEPYPDQWAFLKTVEYLPSSRVKNIIFEAVGDTDPLDVAYPQVNVLSTGKQVPIRPVRLMSVELPKSLSISLLDGLHFDLKKLPPSLLNRLIRLASFANPKFYINQNAGYSTWGTPRVVCSALLTESQLILPRGCLSGVLELLKFNNISAEIDDQRSSGFLIDVAFKGALRDYQEPAFDALMEHDNGMLLGGTSFGKTVISAAIIAERSTNTIVLVDTSLLVEQWQRELQGFLGVGSDVVGTLSGNKDRTTGIVDVVLIQSLANSKKHVGLINRYGQVIIDECDCLGAESYEALMQTVTGKYIVGLSANKKRRDGHHPKIFMQCGPLRFVGDKPKNWEHEKLVKVHWHHSLIALDDRCENSELISYLIEDQARNQLIIQAILDTYTQGRKILVLTARIKQIDLLEQALKGQVEHLLVVRGGVTLKKDKQAAQDAMNALLALPNDTPRVVIATGKKGGKGFSHNPLNTLVIATPISNEDDVKQYAGRVDRTLNSQDDIWIIDIVDTGHKKTNSMWKSRRSAYKKHGWRVQCPEDHPELF